MLWDFFKVCQENVRYLRVLINSFWKAITFSMTTAVTPSTFYCRFQGQKHTHLYGESSKLKQFERNKEEATNVLLEGFFDFGIFHKIVCQQHEWIETEKSSQGRANQVNNVLLWLDSIKLATKHELRLKRKRHEFWNFLQSSSQKIAVRIILSSFFLFKDSSNLNIAVLQSQNASTFHRNYKLPTKSSK